jgi:hypothetical protein
MIALIRPILYTFVTSRPVKELICDLLDQLVTTTDNQLDDVAARSIRHALLED